MGDASVYYMIRSWVNPDGGNRYVDWLEKTHIAEMQKVSGVLWSRKIALEQADDDGWEGLLMVYGFEDRAALSHYLDSPVRNKFYEEMSEFKDVQRSERFYGEVDFKLDD